MKLITLNIWGGQLFPQLLNFLRRNVGVVDVFCFQEVFYTQSGLEWSGKARANIYAEIQDVLTEYAGFWAPMQDQYDYRGPVDYDLSFGLASFVRRSIPVVDHGGEEFVYRWRNAVEDRQSGTIGRNIQCLRLDNGIVIFNFHGLWNGQGKTDTPARIDQSNKVRSVMNRFVEPKKVLCGDFNLVPGTQSLHILEAGQRNLIAETEVTSTRSRYYKKEPKLADYIIVSQEVIVRAFQVIDVEVSDHLPLWLEFD